MGKKSDNERRADDALYMINKCSDRNYRDDKPGEHVGLADDVCDLISNLRHLCDRFGIDWDSVLTDVNTSYSGDLAEDGGKVQRVKEPTWDAG